jgi:penicillin-binding protein 1B
VRLDKVTNLLADASCPQDYDAAFLDGTAPTQTCDQSAGDQRNVFQKLFGIGKETTVAPGPPVNGMPALPAQPTGSQAAAATAQPGPAPPPPDEQKKKKKGFFAKLFGKGDNDNKQQQADPAQPH